MNLAEKAYIAGIVDGEGTVTLTRKHPNETPSPFVNIFNCNLDLIRWVQKTIGCGHIIKKKPAKKHHRYAYELKIHGNKAINLLNEIKSYLILKKPHADLIVKNYKSVTIRNGRYSSKLLKKKWELVKKIRKLNQRSIHASYNTPGPSKMRVKR